MMPRYVLAAAAFRRGFRTLALIVLDCPASPVIMLGPVCLRPGRAAVVANAELAAALRPYRRQLWQRRAALLMVRLLPVLLILIGLVNVARLMWLHAMPPAVRWSPVLLWLIGCGWLVIAQRPDLVETARLLDRRFRLRDRLGTAAEAAGTAPAGSIVERQVMQAAAIPPRLPQGAWSAPLFRRWERLFVGVLLVGALGAALAAPSGRQAAHAGTQAAARSQARLAQVAGPSALHPLPMTSGTTRRAPSRVPSAPGVLPAGQALSFAASLQMRPGPRADPGTAAAGTDGSLEASLSGSNAAGSDGAARGTQGTQAPSGSTGSTAAQQQRGTAGANGTGAAKTASQGQQGQQGAGSSNALGNPQAGSGGQQGGQSGAQAPGRATQPNAPNAGGQQAPGQSSGKGQGANPFGQDSTASPGHRDSTTRTPAGGSPRGNSSAGRGTGAPGAQGQTVAPNSTQRTNQGSDADPGLRRPHGSGTGATPSTGKPAAPAPAPAAHGAQVTLGGQTVVADRAQGAPIIRIVPASAGPGALNAGAGSVGSSMVQGYVPEDTTQMSAADQALVRAYFDNGGGS